MLISAGSAAGRISAAVVVVNEQPCTEYYEDDGRDDPFLFFIPEVVFNEDVQRYPEKPAILPLPEGIIAPVCRKNRAGCGFVYAISGETAKKQAETTGTRRIPPLGAIPTCYYSVPKIT